MNVGSGNHYSVNRLVELLGGDVEYIPKRPGEPECTFAKVDKITKLLNWYPEVPFEDGVAKMIANIENWRDAPVWDSNSIQKATSSWFKYLGSNTK
jgi:UDP-glucose 4-epimerase